MVISGIVKMDNKTDVVAVLYSGVVSTFDTCTCIAPGKGRKQVCCRQKFQVIPLEYHFLRSGALPYLTYCALSENSCCVFLSSLFV